VDQVGRVSFAHPGAGPAGDQRKPDHCGTGANRLTISGNGASRVFDTTFLSGATVSLSGLTIANGLDFFGGSILNEYGTSLTLTNCTLANNTANGGRGGAIENQSTLR
jgi:hypothetical protein